MNFPTPWTCDAFPHPIATFISATIFDANSTWICQTKGKNAHALAQIIVDAVNANNQAPSIQLSKGATELLHALKKHPFDGSIILHNHSTGSMKTMAMELVTAGLAHLKELSKDSTSLILNHQETDSTKENPEDKHLLGSLTFIPHSDSDPDTTPLCQGPVPVKDEADHLIIPGEHPMESQILPRIITQDLKKEFEDETVDYG